MKLIFDCRFLKIDYHDGISRFSSELFAAVSRQTAVTALICDRRQLAWLPEGTDFLVANKPTDALREFFLPRKLNKTGASHVFAPMQTVGSFGRNYKLVLTLHDLIYYSHPKAPPALSLPLRIAWRLYHLNFWGVRFLLNRSDAVVTISETSKGLIERNNLTTKPVHVVYNGATPDTAALNDWEPPVPRGRGQLVYMGSFMGYKNVECLIDAMKDLPDFELALLSKISKQRREQLTRRAGAARHQISFQNGVSDQEYDELLRGAFALVSASKDEGFGIPLVEAMQRGIPAVVSEIPIFREIAGEAGNFFDPDQPSELVARVHELQDSNTWIRASSAARAQSEKYHWDYSATALLSALEQS